VRRGSIKSVSWDILLQKDIMAAANAAARAVETLYGMTPPESTPNL